MPLITLAALLALAHSQAIHFNILLPNTAPPATFAYIVMDCIQAGRHRFKVAQSPRERATPITLDLGAGNWDCHAYAWTIDEERIELTWR